MTSGKRLSACVATMNEAEVLERCLKSVSFADEIVLVDDESTDETLEVARRFGARVYRNASRGDFHRNKNLAIEKAESEWILFVDADEVIPEELADEIVRTLDKDAPYVAYELNRRNYFMGRWIRGCGWYPDPIIRLFRKGVTEWPLEIHDTPRVADPAKVGRMTHDFVHHSYRSFEQYLDKFNRYTTRLALEASGRGERVTGGLDLVSKFATKPLKWFVYKYLVKGGFRDGVDGLFISISSAATIFVTHAKLRELQKTGGPVPGRNAR